MLKLMVIPLSQMASALYVLYLMCPQPYKILIGIVFTSTLIQTLNTTSSYLQA